MAQVSRVTALQSALDVLGEVLEVSEHELIFLLALLSHADPPGANSCRADQEESEEYRFSSNVVGGQSERGTEKAKRIQILRIFRELIVLEVPAFYLIRLYS